MTKNNKKLFLLTTLVLIIISLSALNAADNNDTSASESMVMEDNAIADSVTTDEVQTDDSRNTNEIKKEESKVLKKANTITVTNNNVNSIFSGENYTLSDSVEEGDTLDFQGRIDKNHSLIINKPVNVISSTKNAVISLHTVSGSLLGDDVGNVFCVNNGGAYSNISGLYINNTQTWIYNTNHVYFNNMTMHVANATVGGGVGQTSIRYSDYITMENCTIYTENNGGSSSFVLTHSSYCVIKDTTIKGVGTVGNLVYLGNQWNVADMPENFVSENTNNSVINCTITGEGASISIAINNGLTKNNTIINNTLNVKTTGINSGTNAIVAGNKLYYGCGIRLGAGCTVYDNVFYGNGSFTTAANSTIYNNTIYNISVAGNDIVFENNTVLTNTVISTNGNVSGNILNDVVISKANATFSNNKVTGFINVTAANVTIENNTINSSEEYAIYSTGANTVIRNNYLVTPTKCGEAAIYTKSAATIESNLPENGGEYIITDETYSNFFDENGEWIDTEIDDYSVITLSGTFNNKNFIFKKIRSNIIGDNAVINNGYLTSTDNATLFIENMKFINTENEYAINLVSDFNTVKNVTLNRSSESGISREIYVEGNNNSIINNKINISVPLDSVDYTDYPFAISKTSAITILASDNTVKNNTIYAKDSVTSGAASLSVIDIASKTSSQNNAVTLNKINVNVSDDAYAYGVNLGSNTNKNRITNNTINVNSSHYACGVQIGYSPADGNNISSNTVKLKSNIAYGVLCSAYGGVVSNSIIDKNTIYINATQSAAIELCGSTLDLMVDNNITNNKIYSNSTYAIGIAASGKGLSLSNNNITVNGTTNATDETSQDIIKATTAGIITYNSENITLGNNTINMTNGPNYILNNTNSSIINTMGSTFTKKCSYSNNTNVILDCSNNNTIMNMKAYTTSKFCVELINSSNNSIRSNVFNASNVIGGNKAIIQDENSANNTLTKNTVDYSKKIKLTLSATSTIIGEDATITVTFNNTVSDGKLEVNNYNNILAEYTIDSETTSITLDNINTDNLSVGSNTITVTFSDSLYFNDTYASTTLTLTNRALEITSISATSVPLGEPTSISIELNDTISDGTITVKINDEAAGSQNITEETDTITIDDVDTSNYNVGDNTITVEYTGSEIYEDATDEGTLTLTEALRKNITISINTTTTAINDKTAITITFNDTVTDGTITTKINDTTINTQAITEDTNSITIEDINTSNYNIGDNTITVEYTGSEKYNDATGEGTLTLTTRTLTITPTATTVPKTDKTTITITLNETITDGTLAVKINDETINTQTINEGTNSITIENVETNTYDIGDNTINVEYSGSELYDDASGEGILTLERRSVELTADSVSITKDVTSTNMTVTLNVSVSDGKIELTVKDEVIGNATISEETSSITIDVDTSNLAVGDNEVIISYTGSELYDNATATSNINIVKSTTTITVNPVTVSKKENTTITATITCENTDVLVNGGKVVFKVNGITLKDANGKVIYSYVTDGVATLSYNFTDMNIEGKTITAVYSGSSTYKASRSANATMEYESLNAEMTLESVTASRGSTITLTATLKDVNDTNINDGKVIFKINGKTIKNTNGKVIYATVTNGTASTTYDIPETYKIKEFTLTAVYISNIYNRQTAETTLTITE